MDAGDEELAFKAMAGDESAFAALFSRYYGPLLRYVEHLAGDHQEAEDLVQEIFVKFLRQRSYQPARPFRPWIFGVTTNAVRDDLRKRQRLPRIDAIPDDQQSTADDPADVVSGRMTAAEVRRLLRELPFEYRATIALRLGADMALEQIAHALGVPVGTVKSRLSNGLKQLRMLLPSRELAR